MTFADTYREERLISRRSRARKARIAGRVIGFALTACLVVALRTDPQLRSMVEDLALTAMGINAEQRTPTDGDLRSAQAAGVDALGYAEDSQEAQALNTLGISNQPSSENTPERPQANQMPQSRVKINRPSSG